MKRMIKMLIAGLLACAIPAMYGAVALHAQQPPRKALLFFEKAYLHTDRDYYTAGEDIWYKVYVTDAQTGLPAKNSNNVYVELLSQQGDIINSAIIRVENGAGHGDCKLDDALPAGRYQLRAYTNWMRNFGNMFVFEKDIHISAGVPAGQPEAVKTNGGKNTVTAAAVSADNRVLFFPEGGAMIAGVNNRVAFKAEDIAGKPVGLSGTVETASGEKLATIQTTCNGMGSFLLQPAPGVAYQVKGRYANGATFTTDIPAALEQGFTLQVNEKDTAFEVQIYTNNATLQALANKRVTIAGKHAGKFYFEDTTVLQGQQTMMLLPKRVFPEGVAAITLYDAQLRPHSERLVYVEKTTAASLALKTDKDIYKPGEPITLSVEACEADGTPATAALSVAVVDGGIVPAGEENIVNYLLLQSELRGGITNLAAYLDKKNNNRAAQRDLLLRTQGWRDFLWRRVKDTAIVIRYLPEPGITLSGHVKQSLGGKSLPNMNITLMAAEARGNKIYFTKTDSLGNWYMDGLPLYGSQPVSITSRNKEGKKGGMLLLDSVMNNKLVATALPAWNSLLSDTAAPVQRFAAESGKRQALIEQQQKDAARMLEGVTVKNTPKKAEFRDGFYTSFGGPDSTFSVTAADDKDYGTLENFILHRMPGATTDAESQGVYFYSNGQKLRPRFKVNKVEDVFERLDYYTLPMSVIEQVTIRHMIGATMNDAWFIYLTLKPEAWSRKQLDLLNTTVTGYYEAREFYVPRAGLDNPAQDKRTTLYWKPDVNINGKITLPYVNSVNTAPVRVIVEGITGNGSPVTALLNYNIK
ncbi:hypothetical protein SAMN05421788_111150 [Filimonas lacunae]|uniref:Macroglobulin domain-containing protein n=1 Tax=Filimonas lacunae TaxID=477680 RepID=A0A173MAU2_9BACT|nr:MG2 domain-containing protein [Filimonas lacunae]BAV04652.1 hypothetical protein FLA_0644 [Filimonas lacunae]SIT32491.1 hypothetical protein SAMN05421788_111150 [Filimonas lacunae]